MTIEEALGYTFLNAATLTRALTRKAHANEKRQHGIDCEDQDILATLGDAVLKSILVDHLIQSGCTTPDEITQAKKELEREELLASVAREIGIGPFLFLGKGEEKQKARDQPYVLAESLEAIIGAVFRDGGYEAAEQLVRRWFDQYLPRMPGRNA